MRLEPGGREAPGRPAGPAGEAAGRAAQEREGASEEPEGEGRDGSGLIKLFLVLTGCMVLVFGVVRPFVADVYRIASTSMTPTLREGDRVVANKLAYRFGAPAPGDLVVFQEPSLQDTPAVKRVVAVGGDRVAIRDGVLVVDGVRQDEPYVDRNAVDSQFSSVVTVPQDSIYVLGDNRADSRDSRQYGPVPEDQVLGEVVGAP